MNGVNESGKFTTLIPEWTWNDYIEKSWHSMVTLAVYLTRMAVDPTINCLWLLWGDGIDMQAGSFCRTWWHSIHAEIDVCPDGAPYEAKSRQK